MIDRLRVMVPTPTALVLLGPPPPGSGIDLDSVAEVRDALASVAREKHVHYADPVRDRWVSPGSTAGLPELAGWLAAYLSALHLGRI